MTRKERGTKSQRGRVSTGRDKVVSPLFWRVQAQLYDFLSDGCPG
jgi:hypothetical protein